MSFLPERHSERFGDYRPIDRHVERPTWRPVPKQRTSILPFLLVGGLGVLFGVSTRTVIEPAPKSRPAAVERPARHQAPPVQREATAPTRCSDPDGTIHGWQGNGTGITPHDWLHFLPPCEGGRR